MNKRATVSSEAMKAYRKAERERKANMTPEEKERERALAKERKAWREEERRRNKEEREARKLVNTELKILKFMKRTGVEYHHHGSVDMVDINSHIETVKTTGRHTEYDSYYWNYSPNGSSQMPISLLGCLFSSSEFNSIYDVPLDGTYRFQIYDSGQRGLGSFNRITAIKVEEEAYVPYVNPGAMIPIIAN